MITPKEKAEELVNKYKPLCKDLKSVGILDGRAVYINDDVLNNASAKQCALIAVDEILSTRPGSPYPQDVGLVVNGVYNIINYPEKYWQEVKQEIELL